MGRFNIHSLKSQFKRKNSDSNMHYTSLLWAICSIYFILHLKLALSICFVADESTSYAKECAQSAEKNIGVQKKETKASFF